MPCSRSTARSGSTSAPATPKLRLRADGTPVLLEIGARMGGSGTVHYLVQTATGVDFLGAVLHQAIHGELPELRPAHRNFAADWILPVTGSGTYAGLAGADEVRRHAGHPPAARADASRHGRPGLAQMGRLSGFRAVRARDLPGLQGLPRLAGGHDQDRLDRDPRDPRAPETPESAETAETTA